MSKRFGENFVMKPESRLDTKNNIPVPEYVANSRSIREMLKKSAEQAGCPEMPTNITSLEDFLEGAKIEVTKTWNQIIGPVMEEKCAAWADKLAGKEGCEDMEKLLRDPQTMEKKLMIHQIGVLEALRPVLPEAWRELVVISSERQLAAVVVARHWLTNLSESDGQSMAETMGLKSIEEIRLLLDSASLLGKYIDHAYVKQIELADTEGGSVPTPLAEKSPGAQYLYDIPSAHDGGEIDIKPYVEVFPNELSKLVIRFKALADKTEQLMADEKIGNEYKKLPAYLRSMAEAYGSTDTEPDSLFATWQKLLTDMRDLAKDGCPIMLVPQAAPGVAGDANKVDMEIRLGFRTREAVALEGKIDELRDITQGIIDSQVESLDKPYSTPPVIVNYQPFAFGPNVYWTARGESSPEKIVAHTNAVIDVAVTTAYPILDKMFSGNVSEEEFKQGAMLDNTLHELGHVPANKLDKKVAARVGTSKELAIVEELKADTVDQKLVWEYSQKGGKDKIDLRVQLMAKLGDVCDYLKNKSSEPGTSGERYFYDGVAIITRLLDKGIIKPDGEKFKITDHSKGVQEIAGIADEVLALYTSGTPEKIQEYVGNLRTQAKQGKTKEFIDKIKS